MSEDTHQLIEELEITLELVAAGIWRDRKKNACGLSGAGIVVHAVERSRKQIKRYRGGRALLKWYGK